jgi:membrane protease YdiL (CAAX protease family)
MRILPQKLSDFGLIAVGFNYLKILLVTLCIQAIPFTLFLILLFTESLLLSQWMLLSLQQLFLVYVLLSPLAEELFFRGLIQTILSPLQILNLKILDFSLTAPVVITSVLFAVAHFAYSLQALVFIIALSIFCGYLRERSQSVIPGIFAHAVFNIFSVFIPKVIMLVLEKYA